MKRYLALMLFISLHTLAHNNNASTQDQTTQQQSPLQFVNFMFTDLSGKLREVTCPAWMIDSAIQNGLCFDGSSIPGCTSIRESDLVLKPDINASRDVPWTQGQERTASVICDIYRDATTPYSACPRHILKNVLGRAHAMGYEFFVGPELEFFLLKQDDNHKSTPCDTKKYFEIETNLRMGRFKKLLLNALMQQNISVEKLHHEVACGQHEMSLRYGNALDIADQVMLAKHTIYTLAPEFGLQATFLPKPIFGQNGSAMHVHFSLYDTINTCNAFYDVQDPYKLSETAHYFIAGILHRIEAMTAILNPIVNSYKRLVPGYEAPILICWGSKNRSALIRIPYVNQDQASGVRAEIRSPDAASNPYLVFAALLHAGLEGIKYKEALQPAVEDNLYKYTPDMLAAKKINSLPHSLGNALHALEKNTFAAELLGERGLHEFMELKTKELHDFNTAVTDWELAHYSDI